MSVISDKITSNGETFTRADYNGVSILIRDKDGYINVTKIYKDNNVSRQSFNTYMNSEKWKEICNNFKNNFLSVFTDRTEIIEFYNINNKEHEGYKREIYGTYVHPDLVHFVAEWCNISYAFKVSVIMNNINTIKNLTHVEGNENLDNIINKQKQEIKRLSNTINEKDDIIKRLEDKVDKLLSDNKEQFKYIDEQNKKLDEQTKQIDELMKENKKQTDKLNRLTDINLDLKDHLVGNKGRLTGEGVKDSKLLMMYLVKDKNNNTFIKIIRSQIDNLKGTNKRIYNDKGYLFLSYLPEAINQNKEVLNNVLIKKRYKGYIKAINNGGITKLLIDKDNYLLNHYGSRYKTFSTEKIDNKIKLFVDRFITSYKNELEQQINIPPIDEGDE